MPDRPATFADRIDGESFDEWYRERRWARNIREGQPYFNGPASVPPVERHSPSQLLKCHRKLYYRKANAPAEREEPKGIFWTGSRFEEDVAMPFLQDVVGEDAYVRNSMWVDFEEETPAGTVRFRGETDPCIVDRQSKPLLAIEIKTKEEVDHLDGPNRHHRAQVHAYMRGLSEKFDRGVTEAVVIYGSRKTMTVRAFHVPFDSGFWQEVIAWAADQTESRDAGVLPPADPEYGWECQFCPYRHRCGQTDEPSADEGPSGFLPGVDEYPREQVITYLNAHDDARLTPALAEAYPDLADEYEVARWSCSTCSSRFAWNDERFENASGSPACPTCAKNDVLAELRVGQAI
jgi:CRISPR/Cas system-associated exonuclease Cas4 (RecB family)